MKERPILFSGPMVRAILDGRKTQTRRVVKGVPSWDHYGRDIMDWGLSGIHQETYDPNTPIEGTDRWHLDVQTDVDDHSRCVIRCPYGAPGDRLWVRETLRRAPHVWTYSADGAEVGWPARGSLAFKSRDVVVSIHMPRQASRITLEISGVRVERLNDCSRDDAKAEGLSWMTPSYGVPGIAESWAEDPRNAYRRLWEHINGPGSWATNPWVWVVEFKRVTAEAAAAAA